MQHRKLDRLMTPVERIARVAAAGLTSATSSATRPSGAKSYDNADGTRTVIGNVANGESNPSYTMATHVGDTTAPGTPTGVTASSKSGVVVVEWDGTLSGGIPDDFYAVRVYLDGSELGILTGAGSVSSASLEGGTTHSVTATAEDDACLPDGTPAHNVSAATAAISVTVSEGVESVAAIAQEALDVAEATGQHFWSDTDGIHVTEVTEDEWSDSTSPNYHSGANVLLNALGQLFRDGLNNLLAIMPSGIAIYDGNGNAQTNIVASFTQSLIELGKNSANAVIDLCAGGVRMAYDSARVGFTILSSMRIYLLSEGNSTTNATLEATSINESTSVSRTASINAHASTSGTSQQIMLEVYEGDGSTEYQSVSLQSAGFRINGGTPTKGVFFGTKVLTVSNASTFVLFTKAQLQAIVGTSWTPTGANCSVFVMNGDHGVTANMMTASIDASSVVRVHMNANRNGAIRVNYLIVRFA